MYLVIIDDIKFTILIIFECTVPFLFFFFFLVGSRVLVSMVVQQLAVILMLSQEEMNICLSLPPSSPGSPNSLHNYNVAIYM